MLDELDECRQSELQRFMEANRDLDVLGDGFAIRLELDDDGMHLLLEVDGSTARDDLARGWPIIACWAQRVKDYQNQHNLKPRWPTLKTIRSEFRAEILSDLSDLYAQGLSDAAIAEVVNEGIAQELAAFVAIAQRLKQTTNRQNEIWLGHLYFRANAQVAQTVYRTLLVFGYTDEKAQEEIDYMIKELEAGRPAFLPLGGPIDESMVRERLRSRRSRPPHRRR